MKNKLIKGEIIDNIDFKEPLDFHDLAIDGKITSEIKIVNSRLKQVKGECLEFNSNLSFENCEIESISFHGIIINELFTLKNCIISNFMDLSGSRFEPNENHFIIANNNFNNVVTFEDCNFKSAVEIVGNNFNKGTDLNTVKQLGCYYPVKDSIINNNKGNLKLTEKEESVLWNNIA